MKIGFLVIGNEILQGKIQDANGPWLTKFLRPYGIVIHRQVITGDGLDEIQEALEFLYRQCELVICSGGLGPTPDDVTKAALGLFFKLPAPAFSEQAKEIAEANYQRFSRTLPDGHGYTLLSPGFVALSNPSGFAPGLVYSHDSRVLLAAPGVPKEFRDLLALHLPPLLESRSQRQDILFLNFRTKGIPEERIFTQLCPGLWEQLATYGKVSSLPHAYSVDVGVVLEGSAQELQAKSAEVRTIIGTSALAPYVWHVGAESLEEVILAEAGQKNLTISFAESCTGGLCAHRLTNIPGSSAVFWGGVVSYDNSIKQQLLGVQASSLAAHGAVSEVVATEMARGGQRHLGTHLCVALTGIAGPGGGSAEKPVGTVWIALASAKTVRAERFEFKGDREALKFRFSQVALFQLLDLIREH